MNRTMITYAAAVAVVLLGVAMFSMPESASAQDFDLRSVDSASPVGVWFGVKGGVVLTSPRGDFPSIVIGEDSVTQGSGLVSSDLAESGTGGRFAIATVIPFTRRIALTLETGTMYWVAKYAADTGRLPTKFELQTWQIMLGVQGTLFSDEGSYTGAGLRNLYVDAGFDLTAITLMNRVETTAFDQDGMPGRGVGSFDNTTPFSNPIALRFGAGARFAATTHLELLAEAHYNFTLNDVFSNDALPDSDFTVHHLLITAGLGYRW